MPTARERAVADVLDVARALRSGVPGLATRAIQLEARKLAPIGDVEARYYLRFQVFDRPGVLAKITGALGAARVSIEQMVQQGGGDSSGAAVQVVILTHVAERSARGAAGSRLGTIAKHDYVAARRRGCFASRIEGEGPRRAGEVKVDLARRPSPRAPRRGSAPRRPANVFGRSVTRRSDPPRGRPSAEPARA